MFSESGIPFEMVEPGLHIGRYEGIEIEMKWHMPQGGWDVTVHVPNSDGLPTRFWRQTRGTAVRHAIELINS